MQNELFFTILREGGTLLILGFFVWYFMKQLEERDTKIDSLQKSFLEQEKIMLNALNANTSAFDRLCKSIDSLESSLHDKTMIS